MNSNKNKVKVAIIGAGLGGLSTAALLAKDGYEVTIYEKNSLPGGRVATYQKDGFLFDMGPSWYLMPDAFEFFFSKFEKHPSDYYELKKLDPSYKVFFGDGESLLIKPDLNYMYALFEQVEKGAGAKLKQHLSRMKAKYELGVPNFLLKEYRSPIEFADPKIIPNLFNLQLTQSYHDTIANHFKDERLQKILEFMVVFLGGSPYTVPGLYNLINWADLGLNVYYPMGGFSAVAKGFEKLADEQGVKINYNSNVEKISVTNGNASHIVVNGQSIQTDIVISNADYAFTEINLLESQWQEHSFDYWDNADLSPSAVCFFLGIDRKLNNLEHHTLFFNEKWKEHFSSISEKEAPNRPQYYVSTPSKTDNAVAPAGKENLFVLVPVAAGLEVTEELVDTLFIYVAEDILKQTGEDIRKDLVHKRSYTVKDFEKDYNAFKGNAFGLGHTLKHSLFFRPKNQSNKVKNLFYTGQFTNPGTGTPLVILSGMIIKSILDRKYK